MAEPADHGARLLGLYDRALPQVYGYLRARVPGDALAEDLTAETFLAAVQAVRKQPAPDLTVGWLVTVARNKLVDHWRRAAREERGLRLAADAEAPGGGAGEGGHGEGGHGEGGEDERFERMR